MGAPRTQEGHGARKAVSIRKSRLNEFFRKYSVFSLRCDCVQVRASSSASLKMSFTLPLRDDNCNLRFVDAVSAYRKYDEENRVVLVGKQFGFF